MPSDCFPKSSIVTSPIDNNNTVSFVVGVSKTVIYQRERSYVYCPHIVPTDTEGLHPRKSEGYERGVPDSLW